MIVAKTLNYSASKYSDKQSDIVQIDTDLLTIFNCLQGRVRFGPGTDGNDGENIAGQWQQFTSNGSANTQFNIAHTLGSVPIGYIVLWQDKAGSFYQGPTTGTAWTSTQISLKCSVASVAALIFLFK